MFVRVIPYVIAAFSTVLAIGLITGLLSGLLPPGRTMDGSFFYVPIVLLLIFLGKVWDTLRAEAKKSLTRFVTHQGDEVAMAADAADPVSKMTRAPHYESAEAQCFNFQIAQALRDHRAGREVIDLSVFRESIDDPCMVAIGSISSLESLELYSAGVTDDGLAHLASLARLRMLSLSLNRSITGAGLRHLEGLVNLEELVLKGLPGISDSGLAHLQKLVSLRKLDLYGTKVSEMGMFQLTSLGRLEELDLPFSLPEQGLPQFAHFLKLFPLLKRVTVAGPYDYALYDRSRDAGADARWALLGRELPDCQLGVRLE